MSSSLDIIIGSFQIPGAASQITRISTDNKRLLGLVGARVQKIFDKLRWNTTYVLENLAGVYIKENDSYTGLLERNKIDLYFTPNSINIQTTKIGLSQPVVSNKLSLLQIIDPPKVLAASDIMNINVASNQWFFHGLLFVQLVFTMFLLLFRSYFFILKLLNKKLNKKNISNLLLTSVFYIATMFVEQLKTQDRSKSFFRFCFSISYTGVWLFNKLIGGLMQTEAWKIDISKIIANFDQTLITDLRPCLIINEPMTYDFIGLDGKNGKKKIFSFMFPFKPRGIYRAKFNDILNLIANYKTDVLVATDVFIKSVGWSVCSYFKDQIGSRKVFIPRFIIDEDIAAYYFNLRASKKIINSITKSLAFAAFENALISYQRNPPELNILDSDVQNFCVVRSLKVLKEASVHTSSLNGTIKLDSYFNIFALYFMIIILIFIITLVLFFFNYIKLNLRKMRKDKDKKRLRKLGNQLKEESLLKIEDLDRNELDRLYLDVKIINQIIDSSELQNYLNTHIDLIDEQYQLMRLKYRIIQNKIENKILKQDGHFQMNRDSIIQLISNFTDPRLSKIRQRDILIKSQYNQQIKTYLHVQNGEKVNFQSAPSNPEAVNSSTNEVNELSKSNSNNKKSKNRTILNSSFLKNTKSTNLISSSSNSSNQFKSIKFNLKPTKLNSNYSNLELKTNRVASDYIFKYSLPDSLDLVLNKYKKSLFNKK